MKSNRRIWPIHGGLNLPPHKSDSTAQAIVQAPVPPELVLPLHQHIGEEAKPCVEVGAHVRRGQLLAKVTSYVAAPVHASSSGRVSAIEDRPIPHPSGLRARCIVIETDGLDESVPGTGLGDFTAIDPVLLRAELRRQGLVGLGGAAFPSAVKLNRLPHHQVRTLILNGAECEPHISCDDMVMRERAEDIITGARIMMYMLAAEECLVAIETDKPEAIEAIDTAIARAQDSRLELVPVPTVYPEGGEKQLIQVLTGREVPADHLSADVGVVCHNVATAAQVKRTIIDGDALTSRIVTVTGGGVAKPRNLDVRLGTPISWLIAQCGGYTDKAERLIMGGPMMGFTLDDDSAPIVKASNCILVAAHDEVHAGGDAMPCIRCGECARACPVKLLPQQLYWFSCADDHDELQSHHLFDCIECGCCAYVCPSRIPLVQFYRASKSRIWQQEQERERAERARERFEKRERRLSEQKLARKQRLAKRRAALHEKGNGNKVQEAVERARKRRAAMRDEEPPE